MSRRSPTGQLETEHRAIEHVIRKMVQLNAALARDGALEIGSLLRVVEFMRTFADRCHHGKEEGHLFPILERKGVPAGWFPLGILIRDHEKTRTLVQALARGSERYGRRDPAAKETLAESLRGLVDIYPNHMWKEDYLLFPMVKRLLSPKQRRDLREKFDGVDADIGRDTYQRLEQWAWQLEDQPNGSVAGSPTLNYREAESPGRSEADHM